MIEPKDLHNLVIMPACSALALHFGNPAFVSPGAQAQLLRTAACESDLRWRRQQGGPARSWLQVEPATGILVGKWMQRQSDERWKSLLNIGSYKMQGMQRESQLAEIADRLEDSPFFAAIVARVLYWSIPSAMPAPHQVMGQAAYWKDHYNTAKGKGTIADFMGAHDYHLVEYERSLGWLV